MTKSKKILIYLSFFLLAGFAFSGQDPEILKFIQEVKKTAAPLTSVEPETEGNDLDGLKDIIGEARIILLGESQHMMHEQYLLKHRIIRYLVEEMDFTQIAIEDSFYGTIAINQYINGLDISPEGLLRDTCGWYLWDTEEMLAFIKWLREHNDSVTDEQKVAYTGIDIQDPWPGVKYMFDYFKKTDPKYADYLENKKQIFEVFNQLIWIKVRYGYADLDQEQKQNIEAVLNEIIDQLNNCRQKYISLSSEKGFRNAALVVKHLLKSHEFFMGLEESDSLGGSIREEAMFENVNRILKEIGENEKLIIWVHNAHAAKSPLDFLFPKEPEFNLELLGTMLTKKYGDTVKSLGIVSLGFETAKKNIQRKEDVLDHVLSDTGMDLFLLNLYKVANNKGEKNLWEDKWKLTADQGAFISLVPASAYDGLFFIKHTSRVRLSQTSLKRLSGGIT